MASSNFGRMLSVGAIRFEDGFCTSKKKQDRGRWAGFSSGHGSYLGWLLKSLGQHSYSKFASVIQIMEPSRYKNMLVSQGFW